MTSLRVRIDNRLYQWCKEYIKNNHKIPEDFLDNPKLVVELIIYQFKANITCEEYNIKYDKKYNTFKIK